MLLKLSYVCMPTSIATIAISYYLDGMPVAICCCLQHTVIDVLLMCLLVLLLIYGLFVV